MRRTSSENPRTLLPALHDNMVFIFCLCSISSCSLEQTIQLVTFGEGPVVYVHPPKIDFGCIQVLRDASRTLYLSNQSIIPALFEAQMVSRACQGFLTRTVTRKVMCVTACGQTVGAILN